MKKKNIRLNILMFVEAPVDVDHVAFRAFGFLHYFNSFPATNAKACDVRVEHDFPVFRVPFK